MVTKEERAVYTVEEAGKLLNLSRPTAYRMAREGRLPVISLGRKLLVPKSALEKMLSEVKPTCNVG
jgi:excisionase family DNA binding protein